MAEGGIQQRPFKDSFSKASGDADESFCDPCKSVGKWIAVEGYCQICEEYLCQNCLGVHRKQRITRAHAILDTKQMPRGQGSVIIQDLCVEVCKTHHPEMIRFYCKAHDEPGCGDCMTLKHALCMKDRVQDISDGFQKTTEFKEIDQKLEQLYQELKDMEDVLDNNLKNLDTTYDNILRKITSIRKQINDNLDQIEKKIKDEAAQMKKEDETELKMLHTKNQKMKAEIEVMLQTIHDSNVNVSSLFVITKQAKQRMVTMEKEINKIKQSQQQQYELVVSNELEKIVSNKTPLGKLSRKSPKKVRTVTEKQDEMKPRISTKLFIATYNGSLNVKNETDNKICCITDCTLLSPERMVVIDYNNMNVELIDISNNKVISTHNTPNKPNNVTALSTNMIAVTLPAVFKIQLFDVTTTFTLKYQIKVNNECYGIAYKDGKFAVSYVKPGRVEILDIQGKVLHTIQPNQGAGCVLQQPPFITFGQDNDTVIVSDYMTNKVSVLTFMGETLHAYTHATLVNPRGIAITADGVLFVCNWGNGCIHAVSPDFKTSKIIIKNDNNVVNPSSITYCGTNQRLYISNTRFPYKDDLQNQIKVYDLKVPVYQ